MAATKTRTPTDTELPAPPPRPVLRLDHELREDADDREASAAAVVNLVKAELAERVIEDTAEYLAAVNVTAAGTPLDPAEVVAVLKAAERTAEQFAAAVDARRRRIEWADLAARRPVAERELQNANNEVYDLEAEKRRLEREIDEKILAACRRRQRAEKAIGDAMTAEMRLQQTYRGPQRVELDAAQKRADAIYRRMRSLAWKRDEAQGRLNDAAQNPGKYQDGEADRQRALVAELNEQIRAAVREQEAAVAELNAAAFAMRTL